MNAHRIMDFDVTILADIVIKKGEGYILTIKPGELKAFADIGEVIRLENGRQSFLSSLKICFRIFKFLRSK